MRKIIIVFFSVLFLVGCGNPGTAAEQKINHYSAYLDVELDMNFIFSTYNVDIYFDSKKLGTVEQGKHFTVLQKEISEGTHSIKFTKEDDTYPDESIDVDVDSDKTITVEIKAHGSEIEVLNKEIENSLAKTDIEVPDAKNKILSDAKKELEDLGFINIKPKADTDSVIWDDSNWTVISQNIEAGKITDKNTEIILTCKHNEEPKAENNTKPNEDDETDTTVKQSEEPEEPSILTVDNCEDLANLLTSTDEEMCINFANKYRGKTIQFNASIDDIMPTGKHGKLYNILFSYGDYSATEQIGPTFKIQDMSISSVTTCDINGDKTYLVSDVIRYQNNIILTANVSKYDENLGIMFLSVNRETSKIQLR